MQGLSGPGSNCKEGVLRIPQISSITGALLFDCLESYIRTLVEGVLPLCGDAVDIFYSPIIIIIISSSSSSSSTAVVFRFKYILLFVEFVVLTVFDNFS